MKRNSVIARATFFVSLGALSLGAAMCASPTDQVASPGSASPSTSTPKAAGARPAQLAGRDMHPYARPEFDVGLMATDKRLEGMSLLFQMSPRQKSAAASLQRDLENPASPRYHQWITPTQYAAQFGASPQTIAQATTWLKSQGFTVHGPASTGARLFFSGTVGQLNTAFKTEMHRYDVNGEHHFALAVQPTYPAEIAASVLGLRGIHDFRMKPTIRSAAKKSPITPQFIWGDDAATSTGLADGGGVGEWLNLAPADFTAIYDVDALYSAGITGTGQKIAIVGESDFNDIDIQTFRQTFNLDVDPASPNLPTRDFVPYSGNRIYSSDAFGEAELDLEWSGGIAKDASVYYVFTGDNPVYGVWDAVAYAIERGTYPLISASYGGCELYFSQNETIFLSTMGDAASMQGTTILNSSGDWGAAGCDAGYDQQEVAAMYGPSVSWPASIPSFVAVGGTELNWGGPPLPTWVTSVSGGYGAFSPNFPDAGVESAASFGEYWGCTGVNPGIECTAKGYVPEMGWNELEFQVGLQSYFWGASGGGESILYPMPYWQTGFASSGGARAVPDVALSASWYQAGYMVSSSWTSADGDSGLYPESFGPSGGTSAAAPSFAGIMALVNQKVQQDNPTAPIGLGNANPVLYALNSSTKGGAHPAFHDITTGDNIVPCQAGSYNCPVAGEFGYSAGTGYDMVTGLGSIDAFNLATAWAKLLPTATTLVVATVADGGTLEGAPVTLTATVKSPTSTGSSNALGGSVLFYLDSVGPEGDAGPLPEVSLFATAAVVPGVGAGGHKTGTASATVVAPSGRLGTANIVAFYAGDSDYLASWSAKASVAATSTLLMTPTAITLSPNEQHTFTTTGGAPPMQWTIKSDTTCLVVSGYYYCSAIEPLTATSGAFQAGGADGTTVIQGFDNDGAEVEATIIVSGAAIDGGTLPPPWNGVEDAGADASAEDASGVADATAGNDATAGDASGGTDASSDKDATSSDASGGTDAATDEDATAPESDATTPEADATTPPPGADASTADSSVPTGPDASAAEDAAPASGEGGAAPVPSSSGCGCVVAGQEQRGAPRGALAGLVFALVAVTRRKRRRG